MIGKVTAAIVETEGLPGVRELTCVLIHDVKDGGWGRAGTQRLRAPYQALASRDLIRDDRGSPDARRACGGA